MAVPSKRNEGSMTESAAVIDPVRTPSVLLSVPSEIVADTPISENWPLTVTVQLLESV